MCEQLMEKQDVGQKENGRVGNAKVLEIRTARIGYRGKEGETVIDTTAKSAQGIGKVFAPTWKLVMAYKRGDISWSEYEQSYLALMRKR